MHSKEEKLIAFSRALDIMDKLRSDCPWNNAQTCESLRPLTIEEVYELSDAVLSGEASEIRKELGDLALHILFYSKIAEQKGEYDIADVLDSMSEKMIFRHPHVFGNASGAKMTYAQVAKEWELRKKKERAGKTLLEGVPRSSEPVRKAYIMQDKASAVGFDWHRKEDVWAKVEEEIAEAKSAVGRENTEEEFGDALFALVNASRLYGVDPSEALQKACEKFRRRFTYMETHAPERGFEIGSMTLEQMDEIWDEAKSKGL